MVLGGKHMPRAVRDGHPSSAILKPFSVNFLGCAWPPRDTKKEIIPMMFLQHWYRSSFSRSMIHKLQAEKCWGQQKKSTVEPEVHAE